MNTRGIVQLVVLNIGVDLGVLSPKLFSIFVLMATILTFLTSPILSLLYRDNDDGGKASVPNVAVDLRNIGNGGEMKTSEVNDNIQTISNGDINNSEAKSNSGKASRKSSTTMPVHDTFVTFDDRINYAAMDLYSDDQSSVNGNTQDMIMGGHRRSVCMTRF
jgi:hypothetical protein